LIASRIRQPTGSVEVWYLIKRTVKTSAGTQHPTSRGGKLLDVKVFVAEDVRPLLRRVEPDPQVGWSGGSQLPVGDVCRQRSLDQQQQQQQPASAEPWTSPPDLTRYHHRQQSPIECLEPVGSLGWEPLCSWIIDQIHVREEMGERTRRAGGTRSHTLGRASGTSTSRKQRKSPQLTMSLKLAARHPPRGRQPQHLSAPPDLTCPSSIGGPNSALKECPIYMPDTSQRGSAT